MDFLISHNTHQVNEVFVSKHLHIEAKAAKMPLMPNRALGIKQFYEHGR